VTKINVCPAILRKLRENSGFSVEELARKLDVSVEKIIKVEEGRDSLTLTKIKKLADIYKIPLAALFSKDIPDIPSLPDYRLNRERRLSPEVFVAIRRAKYLSEEIIHLSGKRSKIPDFPDTQPETLAKNLREYLKLKIPVFGNPNEALEFYKNILENELNIMVLELPLKSEDVRAFSLNLELSQL